MMVKMKELVNKIKNEMDRKLFEQLRDSSTIAQTSTAQSDQGFDFKELIQLARKLAEKPRYAYILSKHIPKNEAFITDEEKMPFERNGIKYKVILVNPTSSEIVKALIENGVKSAEEIGLMQ